MSTNNSHCTIEVGEETVRLSNDIDAISYSFRLGTFTYSSSDNKVTYFTRGYAQVQTNHEVWDTRHLVYKGISSLDFADDRGQGKIVVIRLENSDKAFEINIRLSMVIKQPGYSIVVQFKNRGKEVSIRSIDSLVIDVDTENRIVTGWDCGNLRFFRNGFHSWDLAQSQQINTGENVSHSFTSLSNSETEHALVIGFVSSINQFTTISALGNDDTHKRLVQILASSLTDDIIVKERGSLVSEELLCLYSRNPNHGLELYADITAQRMQSSKWNRAKTGWTSWYFYYTMPDENEIMANAQFLKDRFGKEIDWIRIDDGYQKSIGDWEVNTRFSGGLKPLSTRIKSLGYKSGIWIAPFIASEHSRLFKDKPDWFIRDDDDNPVIAGENPLWLGKFYPLDLTHPKVLQFIKKTFKELRNEGFDYFKIDFLHYASISGKRHDMSMTRASAIRSGLLAIREAVDDAFIVGSGAPLGPCIGIVNGLRIGNDIGTAWKYDWGGGVYECSINTMTRAFLHNRFWLNDPDCVLVRQDDNNLTLDEVRLWATLVGLSGGLLFLGDRMPEVSEDRLRIIDRLLPPGKRGAFSVDFLESSEPRVFAMPLETPLGRWAVVGVINLSETPIDVTFNLEDVGLHEAIPHHVFNFWDQTYDGLSEKSVTVSKLKAHACQLLCIRPETNTPNILATSIHFTQGAVELSNVSWTDATRELQVKITKSTRYPEKIFITCGSDWKPIAASVNEKRIEFDQTAPEVIEVYYQFQAGQILHVKFASR
ncbi:MAG: alpha-galactosidase [Candidatus Thorarchaeota archaeon]|nr:alpha-galactosidase [Candidatus Thorarchaeota archaeon]